MTGLVIEPDGYRADVIRVDPTDAHVPDLQFWRDRDVSVWLVEDAMGPRNILRLASVRRSVLDWMVAELKPRGYQRSDCVLMADMHIRSALDHPDTPLGIAYTNVHRDDVTSFAIYRGEFYDRDARGALKPWGERDESTPTRAEWAASARMVERWLKARRGES